jgi:hypothetical protein
MCYFLRSDSPTSNIIFTVLPEEGFKNPPVSSGVSSTHTHTRHPPKKTMQPKFQNSIKLCHKYKKPYIPKCTYHTPLNHILVLIYFVKHSPYPTASGNSSAHHFIFMYNRDFITTIWTKVEFTQQHVMLTLNTKYVHLCTVSTESTV